MKVKNADIARIFRHPWRAKQVNFEYLSEHLFSFRIGHADQPTKRPTNQPAELRVHSEVTFPIIQFTFNVALLSRVLLTTYRVDTPSYFMSWISLKSSWSFQPRSRVISLNVECILLQHWVQSYIDLHMYAFMYSNKKVGRVGGGDCGGCSRLISIQYLNSATPTIHQQAL